MKTYRIVLHLGIVDVVHRHGIEEFSPDELYIDTGFSDASIDLDGIITERRRGLVVKSLDSGAEGPGIEI